MSSITQLTRNMISFAAALQPRIDFHAFSSNCHPVANCSGDFKFKIFNFVHFFLNQSEAITCIAEVIIQESTHKILLMAILHAA